MDTFVFAVDVQLSKHRCVLSIACGGLAYMVSTCDIHTSSVSDPVFLGSFSGSLDDEFLRLLVVCGDRLNALHIATMTCTTLAPAHTAKTRARNDSRSMHYHSCSIPNSVMAKLPGASQLLILFANSSMCFCVPRCMIVPPNSVKCTPSFTARELSANVHVSMAVMRRSGLLISLSSQDCL